MPSKFTSLLCPRAGVFFVRASHRTTKVLLHVLTMMTAKFDTAMRLPCPEKNVTADGQPAKDPHDDHFHAQASCGLVLPVFVHYTYRRSLRTPSRCPSSLTGSHRDPQQDQQVGSTWPVARRRSSTTTWRPSSRPTTTRTCACTSCPRTCSTASATRRAAGARIASRANRPLTSTRMEASSAPSPLSGTSSPTTPRAAARRRRSCATSCDTRTSRSTSRQITPSLTCAGSCLFFGRLHQPVVASALLGTHAVHASCNIEFDDRFMKTLICSHTEGPSQLIPAQLQVRPERTRGQLPVGSLAGHRLARPCASWVKCETSKPV